MTALGARANALEFALEWESERHNPSLQQTQDQRKRTPQDARGRLQLVEPAPTAAPSWLHKLQTIPVMRSGLMPLDESAPLESWSKPFSLIKADFEPWLSFYAGYRGSRLFLDTPKQLQASAPVVDFAIRALSDLKNFDIRLIIEPPVQIDRPVEYFDAQRAPTAGRGAGQSQSLARAAEAMHRGQLRRAVERGRDMGNQLHEALLGEGLANLIHAWEKNHQRKPNVEELHNMLTTGRTSPVQARGTPAARASQAVPGGRRQSAAGTCPIPAPADTKHLAAERPATLPNPLLQQTAPSLATRSGRDADVVQTTPAGRSSPLKYFVHGGGLICVGVLAYLLAA